MHTYRLRTPLPLAIIRGALAALAITFSSGRAVAQDTPQGPRPGTVEIGASNASDGSYKAGEYNGLQNKGVTVVGNVDFRSVTPYNSTSNARWRVTGTDLGLDTRNLSADARQQGRFKFTAVFDQLRRNRSDSYQTPLLGAGSNVLTLPSFWQVPTVAGSTTTNSVTNITSARGLVPSLALAPYIDTRTSSTTMGGVLTPTAAQAAQVAAAAPDGAAFANVNLHTTRTRFDVALNYIFNDRWTVDGDFRPEHKDGMKPMGTVSRNTGGDISTVIPDLIDTNHNQLNLSLTFKNDRSFAQVGFYGSSFRNHVPFMSWQNWATPTSTVNTISSAPDNAFGQVHGTAGRNLSPRTKLVVNGSYARGTQNDAFITNATTPVVPVSSLDGLVVTSAFNARLTSRVGKKWNLGAAYKFNDRDNRTAVRIFQYADVEEAAAANANFPSGTANPLGPVLAQNANANRPYSKRSNQFNADAEYALGRGQWIKGGYDAERINRTCNGSWISCADASITNEQTLRADWRTTVAGRLGARVGYAYSRRRTPFYNENAFLALVPYAGVSPANATDGASALSFMTANGWNGWGPAAGFATTTGNMNVFFPSNNALPNGIYANNNRISELPGMRRYYVADRNRDKVRGSADYQVTDAFSLQAGVDLNNDLYPGTVYGLQHARGWAADLDGSYAVTGTVSADVFYTFEDQHAVSAGNTYTANSNTATITNGQPGVVGLSGNAACDPFVTLQQRNNNNKLDPCLNWSSTVLDRAKTGGFGLRTRAGQLDVSASVVISRARWDNNVNGGNWANNLLNGPGAAPTTVAAWYIPATSLPTVTTNSAELRLGGLYSVAKGQALRVAYDYLRMTSSDFAYEGMQIGTGTVAGVLPTNEQPFNYHVHFVSVSYIVTF